jgi:molybdopterin/thiamine biosynthesis adenylyltransferase
MNLAESLNRTMKLALDEGKAASYADAQRLFRTFRLRIAVGAGFAASPAAEAAVLTLLNAAPKTFLGGVELVGDLQQRCTMAWFRGQTLAQVAEGFAVLCRGQANDSDTATILVGGDSTNGVLELGLHLDADGFTLDPEGRSGWTREAAVAVGVAAAGVAINEAFQRIYRGRAVAGARRIRFELPRATRREPFEAWLIGLGHLGQAYLWTLALHASPEQRVRLRLTDYDEVTLSSLSTCLLVDMADIGRKKVDAVADKLAKIGFDVVRDASKLVLDEGTHISDFSMVLVAVDNIGLRRGLDRLRGARILESGIGHGAEGFTRVQMHAFPGRRLARDVWHGEDSRASRRVDISQPAYQALLRESGDECGTTLVASRSVATPFVGAFAGAVLVQLSGLQDTSDAWNFDLNGL